MNETSFKPAWWLPNPHCQTLWPTLFRPLITDLKIFRERIELSDGDFIDLDWTSEKKEGPLIILLHGLEGSIQSPYAKGMMKALHQQGWRVVFMHFRGCSGEHNRLPRTYHSGETGDVDTILNLIRQREPNTLLAGIGFSLGGNVLLKWLGETGHNNPLSAAIAVSVPFELHKSVQRINKGFAKFYQWHLLKCLRKKILTKFENHEATPFDKKVLERISRIQDFDDLFTAPMHGFKNSEDYYQKSSSRQFLKNIQVPTLLIQAKDDPFMTLDLIPNPRELSSQVILELTEKGGHVGFISGSSPWQAEYWLEQRVPLFLKSFLS